MPNTSQPINSDIRDRLSSISLPTMPQVLVKLMELCQSNDVDISELADLIAYDVALTTKILGRASSALYKRGNKQADLKQSIQIIGMDMIKVLCISESVYQVFDGFKQVDDSVLQGFWNHSVLTAISARLIAKGIGYPNIEEAYLAGLLHDVGRLALLSLESEEYVIEYFSHDDDFLCKLERRIFKLSHAEAGAWMIEQWNFDSFFSDSVLYHHEATTRLKNTHPLIRIVSLAELLTHHLLEKTPIPLEIICSLCGSDTFDQKEIEQDIIKRFKETLDVLGMDSDGIINQKEKATTSDANIALVSSKQTEKHRLSDQLRNYILASEVDNLFAKQNDSTDIFETVLCLACLLFDFKDAVIFIVDKNGHFLQGIPSGENRQYLADFSIPLDNSSSAISEAVLHKRLTFIDSENNQLQIIEEQLQRILGTQCLVCIPFSEKEKNLGVLVGGINPDQVVRLRQRSDFLLEFAVQATAALKTEANKKDSLNQQSVMPPSNEFREKTRRIVHEVNNPLSIIKNYLHILNIKIAKKELIGEEILILTEEIDRVSDLVNSLTRPESDINIGFSEINNTVNGIVKLFLDSGFVPPSIEIVVYNSDQECEVDCPVKTLKQILMNLIKNSVEAMQKGGKIEIDCKDFANLDGRKYIRLMIKDNGLGIKEEIMDKLFSSTQSTKDEIHRGLGLGIVYDLVSKNQGHISCRSHKEGTSFEILLPIHNASSKTKLKG